MNLSLRKRTGVIREDPSDAGPQKKVPRTETNKQQEPSYRSESSSSESSYSEGTEPKPIQEAETSAEDVRKVLDALPSDEVLKRYFQSLPDGTPENPGQSNDSSQMILQELEPIPPQNVPRTMAEAACPFESCCNNSYRRIQCYLPAQMPAEQSKEPEPGPSGLASEERWSLSTPSMAASPKPSSSGPFEPDVLLAILKEKFLTEVEESKSEYCTDKFLLAGNELPLAAPTPVQRLPSSIDPFLYDLIWHLARKNHLLCDQLEECRRTCLTKKTEYDGLWHMFDDLYKRKSS